jgi:radical SAM superfamily enzyme YgiQ (UPF0313 family)
MKISLVCVEDNLINIGIRRLASWMRHCGHDVQVLFMPTMNYASIWSRLRPTFGKDYGDEVISQFIGLARDSDLVGFSSMTNYAPKTKSLIACLRQYLPEKRILWGGIHPTVFPEDAIQHADAICLGEGEMALLEFVEALETGRDPTSIRNLWMRVNGEVVRNSTRPLLTSAELDQLPPMDYGTENNYILHGNRIVPLTMDHYLSYCGVNYNTIYTVGCPFSCTYCSNDVFARLNPGYRRIRMPSVDHIINELSQVKAQIPHLHSVVFMDDAFFFIKMDVMQEFATRYREEIGLPFAVLGASPVSITEEKVGLLVSAGLNRVRMGIQSGSPRTLELYNRRTPPESIVDAARVLALYTDALIPSGYDIIVDNPYETTEDTLQTVKLLDRLAPPFTLNIFSLQFLPGTQLARKAFEDGISDSERESGRHYKLYKPTYLNLIISLYGVGKIPSGLLQFLLKSRRVDSDRTYPLLGRLIYWLMLVRRGIDHIKRIDFSLLPGKWAVFASRITDGLSRRRRRRGSAPK